MSRKCIVSFASQGRENYNKAQLGLIRSINNIIWDGGYRMSSLDGYCDQYLGVKIQLGSWPVSNVYGTSWQHIENPYQFKPYAIQAVKEEGYDVIIWADSSIRFLKDPQPLLDLAKERGVLAFNNLGWPVVNWTSDTALKYFNESVESLEGVKQICACFIIFDFRHPLTLSIFTRWIEASNKNVFMNDETNREGFRESRHDQAALSIILHQHGVPLNEYGDGFCYHPHQETKQFGNHPIYAINKGID